MQRDSLRHVLLWLPSFGCLLLSPFFRMLCIFAKKKKSLFFSVCVFFLSVAFFFRVGILSFGGHLSCQHGMLNQFPARGPRGRLAKLGFLVVFSGLSFRALSSLSVVFQVNGINVEPCTHKEVVSPAVIHDFPPFVPGLTLRLSCSAVVPTVGVAFIRVYLGGTFPSSLFPSSLFSSASPLQTSSTSQRTNTHRRGRFSAAEM